MENYADLMFNGAVAELQKADGTFEKYQRAYKHRTADEMDENAVSFIRQRESFYIASVSADGWPYIQHRGGPRGFVHVIGPARLACADYRGNRQFITMGNLRNNDRVSLFFMDYLNRARLKVQGRASLVSRADADQEILGQVNTIEKLPAERLLIVDVVALDWNCPKYIPALYSEAAIRSIITPQITQLKEENNQLRIEIESLRSKS